MSAIRIRQIKEVQVEGLGERIKQARLASPKSLEQICKEVDVSRTYWYDLEKQVIRGALSIENLRKIEIALDTRFDVDFAEHHSNSQIAN